MSEKTILLVYDEADQKHAEVNVMDDAHQAARLVETLLEQGFKQERIRIYTGIEMEMQVTHRPVVALVGDGQDNGRNNNNNNNKDASDKEQADTEEALPRAKAESKEAEANAAPGNKDGVRFSSLFRAT